MKRIFIITGASRGLGKSFAESLNSFYNTDSIFVLLARDLIALESVKETLTVQAPMNRVFLISTDFSSPKEVSEYIELLKPTLNKIDTAQIEKLTVIYNHGTLEIGSVVSKPIKDPLRERFEINLFSSWYLLSAISTLLPISLIPKQVHVNISSAYARVPTADWSAHCSSINYLTIMLKLLSYSLNIARAARESVFKCFALENPNCVKVINFFPGLVQTGLIKN